MRLSAMIPLLFPLSRRLAKDALKKGLISVNGKIIKKDIVTAPDDVIKYLNPPLFALQFNLQDYLLFKNDDVCFLYKPPFIHSERLKQENKLAMSDIWATLPEYKPISRLDYSVDGVVGGVRDGLKITFLQKEYLAITDGKFPDKIIIKNSIDANKRKKVKVLEDKTGFPTIMERLDYNNGYSLIKVTLEKAARHQVRAFCAYLGHPIRGDRLYGGTSCERINLHCKTYKINEYTANCEDYEKITEKLKLM